MTLRGRKDGDVTRAEILDFIKDFTIKYRISPTMREIKNGTSISTESVVKHHVDIMVANGQLTRYGQGKARNLSIPGGVLSYPDDPFYS